MADRMNSINLIVHFIIKNACPYTNYMIEYSDLKVFEIMTFSQLID